MPVSVVPSRTIKNALWYLVSIALGWFGGFLLAAQLGFHPVLAILSGVITIYLAILTPGFLARIAGKAIASWVIFFGFAVPIGLLVRPHFDVLWTLFSGGIIGLIATAGAREAMD